MTRRKSMGGLFLLFVVGTIAYGCYAMINEDDRAEVITIENPSYSTNDLLVQKKHEVVFRVRNDGNRQLEIVGYHGQCVEVGCFNPKRFDRVRLPPGKTTEVPFVLQAYRPGSFSIDVPIFVEDRCGLREITVHAEGTAVAADTNAARPQKRLPKRE